MRLLDRMLKVLHANGHKVSLALPCSVLQCGARDVVTRCVAVCCSVLQCVAVRFVRMVTVLTCVSVCIRAKCAGVNVCTSGSFVNVCTSGFFYMCACVFLSVFGAGRSGVYGTAMVQLDHMRRRVKIHHVL